jgi:phospholipid transport system substrate-binding protein
MTRRNIMNMTVTRFLLATALIACGTAMAAPLGPMATLKMKNTEVDRLLRAKLDAGSPAEKKQADEIKALAGSLLDYMELGRRAMAQHWEGLSAQQRDNFLTKFRELIERHYVKQLRSNLDYQIVYKDEAVEGEEATVSTLVKVKTKGKSTDAEIVYKLKKLNEKWMVYDVITDEVSLVRNYKTQFNKIITEKGFDELLKKIESKIKTEGT